MFIPNFIAINLIVVDTFHSKAQMSVSCWLYGEVTEVIRIHPLGTITVALRVKTTTTFHKTFQITGKVGEL